MISIFKGINMEVWYKVEKINWLFQTGLQVLEVDILPEIWIVRRSRYSEVGKGNADKGKRKKRILYWEKGLACQYGQKLPQIYALWWNLPNFDLKYIRRHFLVGSLAFLYFLRAGAPNDLLFQTIFSRIFMWNGT